MRPIEISRFKGETPHTLVFVLSKKNFPHAVLRNAIKRKIRAAFTPYRSYKTPLLVRVFPTAREATGMDFSEVFERFFNQIKR